MDNSTYILQQTSLNMVAFYVPGTVYPIWLVSKTLTQSFFCQLITITICHKVILSLQYYIIINNNVACVYNIAQIYLGPTNAFVILCGMQ